MDIPKDIDVAKLMNMLSQMDKKQVEEGLNQISKMLNNNGNNSNYNNNNGGYNKNNNNGQTFNGRRNNS